MHDQRTSPAQQDVQIEGAILGLLLDSPAPMSDQEVAREIGDEIAAIDALTRLHRTGLVHRLDGFAFPSRPAARAAALHA
jgi:hypothetical protein